MTSEIKYSSTFPMLAPLAMDTYKNILMKIDVQQIIAQHRQENASAGVHANAVFMTQTVEFVIELHSMHTAQHSGTELDLMNRPQKRGLRKCFDFLRAPVESNPSSNRIHNAQSYNMSTFAPGYIF